MTPSEIIANMDGQIGLLRKEANVANFERVRLPAQRILSWMQPARDYIAHANADASVLSWRLQRIAEIIRAAYKRNRSLGDCLTPEEISEVFQLAKDGE